MLSKFLPTGRFKWKESKEFYSNKYGTDSSKHCVLEVDLKYPKELHELHNNYPLVPGKIEIKKEVLSTYQLKTADFYNIPILTVKKLETKFFDKEKYELHY